MSRAVLIEWQSHTEQDTACARCVERGGLSLHILRLILQKGLTTKTSSWCLTNKNKKIKVKKIKICMGEKNEDPVLLYKRSLELHSIQSNMSQAFIFPDPKHYFYSSSSMFVIKPFHHARFQFKSHLLLTLLTLLSKLSTLIPCLFNFIKFFLNWYSFVNVLTFILLSSSSNCAHYNSGTT